MNIMKQRYNVRFLYNNKLVFNTGINFAFNIHSTCLIQTVDKTSAVGSSGRAGLSIDGTVVQSHLPPFQNLGNFVHPTCVCVFRKRH